MFGILFASAHIFAIVLAATLGRSRTVQVAPRRPNNRRVISSSCNAVCLLMSNADHSAAHFSSILLIHLFNVHCVYFSIACRWRRRIEFSLSTFTFIKQCDKKEKKNMKCCIRWEMTPNDNKNRGISPSKTNCGIERVRGREKSIFIFTAAVAGHQESAS